MEKVAKCIQHATEPPSQEEFVKATKPAIEFMHKYCNPHQTIIIRLDGAELVSGDMAYSVEVPD